MKKQNLILVVIAFIAMHFAGCEDDGIFSRVNGSGDVVDVEYSFGGFERLNLSHAFDVTVTQSDTFNVVLYVDDNIVNYLEVRRSGEWLIIGLDDEHSYNNVSLSADIAMPFIEEIEGSGATMISMNGFSSPGDPADFTLKLSGASVFSGTVYASDCDIHLSGASVINMNGSCNDLFLESSGASQLNMGNFVAASAYFILSGASDGTVHVTDHLDANLSGASVLRYYGDPEIGNLTTSGASTLIKL